MRSRRDRSWTNAATLCVLCGLLLSSAAAAAPVPAAPSYSGRSLEDALLDLRARGLRIVFTSNVVRPEMRVEREPADPGQPGEAPSRRLRRLLEELLAPHGLTARDGPNGIVVVVPRPGGPATSPEDEAGEPPLPLAPAASFYDEIVVTPSQIALLREEPAAPLSLSREDILTLPHLGDDLFRALTLLPGATGSDVSARFHIRGGRDDETQVLLDGQELFDPFHLEDFSSALSFVAPATLSSADLSTGAFSVRYGDRMSGLLDLTTLTPTGSPKVRLDIGILGAQAGSGGSFQDGRVAWLAEARRGSSDLLARLLGDEDPRYWDAFGKLDWRPSPRRSLRAHLLQSADDLAFEKVVDGDRKRFETDYDSIYLWLTDQTILGSGLLLETAASQARLSRDRRGLETDEGSRFAIRDQRDTEVLELRQGWHLETTPKHLLEWGGQLRRTEAAYDYAGTRDLSDPLARLRHDFGQTATDFAGRFEDRHAGAYLTDRVRLLEPLTLELGVRYDRHSLVRESHVSPRLSLVQALGPQSRLRLAWGRFDQSQRPYELLVEDGETAFYPVERAEHRVLGFEKAFDGRTRGLELRVELYQRRVANPRPRYENLFEPINMFPEVEPDRIRIAPRSSVAEGAEVFLRGGLGRGGDGKTSWWINYSYATTEDEIGGRWILRQFDQRHTVNLDLDFRAGEHWRVNLAWRYHTGWPTTPLSLQAVEDEEGDVDLVPLLGRINSLRLPPYHRLDIRASRQWTLRSGSLGLFVDVQNLYNRKNAAGFDYMIDEDAGTLRANRESWPGFLPSVGISFEF